MIEAGSVNCCYQRQIAGNESRVTCQRLLEIAGLDDPGRAEIGIDACQVCQGTSEPQTDFYNDVLASLLYRVAQRIIDDKGIRACSVEAALALRRYAEAGLPVYERPKVSFAERRHQFEYRQTLNCDVVLNLTKCHGFVAAAIGAILSQQYVDVALHIVTLSASSKQVPKEYVSHSSVHIHEVDSPLTDFEAVVEIIETCRSEFIAIQSSTAISDLYRVAFAIRQLIENDGEVFGSDIQCLDVIIPASTPVDEKIRTIPEESLIFRRNTLIDYQLAQTAPLDDVAFVYRCLHDGRKVILSKDCTVARLLNSEDGQTAGNVKTHVATGRPVSRFSLSRVSCDVILPFRDHLDFVQQAIESILGQQNCDVILHLVDDDSRQPTDSFLNHWNQLPNVRCYRNTKNLGQYTSFNNIQKYLETDFIAIQDGDDISLPHRILTAVHRLELSFADIFSGGMQVFGATRERYKTAENGRAITRPVAHNLIRCPKFPRDNRTHFVMNSTVVMRAAKFRELGGFTDFGSPERNRAGLDTEFYLRAYFSNHAKFFLSRQLVSRYRRHFDSATQSNATGFGSPIRNRNREEVINRRERFRHPDFDAREFGAIGRYQEFTIPWDG